MTYNIRIKHDDKEDELLTWLQYCQQYPEKAANSLKLCTEERTKIYGAFEKARIIFESKERI